MSPLTESGNSFYPDAQGSQGPAAVCCSLPGASGQQEMSVSALAELLFFVPHHQQSSCEDSQLYEYQMSLTLLSATVTNFSGKLVTSQSNVDVSYKPINPFQARPFECAEF